MNDDGGWVGDVIVYLLFVWVKKKKTTFMGGRSREGANLTAS